VQTGYPAVYVREFTNVNLPLDRWPTDGVFWQAKRATWDSATHGRFLDH
jgi:hypothetical protein